MSREASAPRSLPRKLPKIDIDPTWWTSIRAVLPALLTKPRSLLTILSAIVLGSALLIELRTSHFEARALSALSARLSFKVEPGPSSRIVFPANGPFNVMRGYAGLHNFADRLKEAGFHVMAQARQSSALAWMSRWNITPPFPVSPAAGLTIRGENGSVLYDAAGRQQVFDHYEDIPPLVVKALLLVENRQLEDFAVATRNPVVDWGRLGKAGLTYAGHKFGLRIPIEGGSTLATQIEKFRYAPGGRTTSAIDKLKQMFSASLRAYRSGPDTRAERRQIVLDYLNSVPLAAAARYGEIYGIGNGLYAWFGMDLNAARIALADSSSERERVRTFKHMLALICAARAPSFYLSENRGALEARVAFYLRQLEAAGAVSNSFARAVEKQPLEFLSQAPLPQLSSYVHRKAANAIRSHLLEELGLSDLYTLDRLDVEAETTLNVRLQNEVLSLFQKLKDPKFVDANGLRQEHLLSRGDPAHVTYSFTLFERTPSGNLLRVQADTLNQPFDLNEGMKLELGSTAKLRTLAHYLEIVAELYRDFHGLDSAALAANAAPARDPITRWTAETMQANPSIELSTLIDRALDREYSGNPGEAFFTGGGVHVFANFDSEENSRVYTLRQGLYQSVNLVYIRLMRDLVRFHQARLAYDAGAVLSRPDHPVRLKLLREIADKEAQHFLFAAYEKFRGLNEPAIVDKLLPNLTHSLRHLAIVFFAWNPTGNANQLQQWVQSRGMAIPIEEAVRLKQSYDPARLNISDYGYLLNRHPLELWCAGELAHSPGISWNDLVARSSAVREIASRWLFKTKNRSAQDRRLRIRFEEDAFARMTPSWQRLGFPFDHLVPSLATAIGSSADRPIALAELMGIILNDGVRLPQIRLAQLRFAAGTPYETVFAPNVPTGARVMRPEVARALRQALMGVVQQGTAGRLANTFFRKDHKPIEIGGKTGSGDNRYETRRGSRAVSRTGTFVFYIGEKYFGVITAYVGQDRASQYAFTSALPVAAIKLLAPTLMASLSETDSDIRHNDSNASTPTLVTAVSGKEVSQ